MSLAQRLPAFRLPALPRPALGKVWEKHHWAVVALWLAFMAGLMGADLYFSVRHAVPQPETAVVVAPTPLPLVDGIDPTDLPLDPAPAPGLEEVRAEGKLPVMAPDGRSPLGVYAYPFDRTEARPRISIVLVDAGPQVTLTGEALRRLPGSVALAYNAYTPSLGTAMAAAREAGHETLLIIPADAAGTLGYDPGPGAVRLGLSASDNMQRIRLLMGKATGYVGLLVNPDTALFNVGGLPAALLDEARARGFALVSANQEFTDLGLEQKAPVAPIALRLDSTLSPAGLDERLAELEQRARESGHVVAISALYPFVITKLAAWLPTLAHKGIAIAPVSAAAPLPAAAAAPAAEAASAPHSSAPSHSAPGGHH